MVILILIIFALPAVWQLIIPGHFQPHDLHHLADIHQMTRAFIGQFPPRWAPDFTHGFGYPLFNFYYVLPFYLGSFFYVLSGSLTESLKLVFLTCFAVSIWGMYKFLREFSSKWASVVGAVVFTYTPYRAVQIYVRGAVGEALALAILPLTAYCLLRLVKDPKPRNIAFVSLSLAAFILTHNYMWFLSLPFVYILLFFWINKKNIKALIVSSILGLGAAAYWVIPAMIELKHVPRLTPFLLEDHFPFVKQLIFSPWGYGASNWGPYDDLSFQIGLVNLVAIAILGLIFLFKFKKLEKQKLILVLWTLACFAIAVVFMNIRTLPIWKLLPIYNFVQFPWRLLYLTAFFSSIAAALVVDLIPDKLNKKLAIILVILSIFLTRNYFKPSGRVYFNDEHYFNLFFNDPNYSEDYLLLTEWTDEKPLKISNFKFQINKGEILEITENTPVNFTAKVRADEQSTLAFNSYYFPGWYAEVDGERAEIIPGKPNGQNTLNVPVGEHEVNVYWAETPLRKVFDIISLLSLASIFYLLLKKDKPYS